MRITLRSLIAILSTVIVASCAAKTPPVVAALDSRWVAILEGPGAAIYLDTKSSRRIGAGEVQVWLTTQYRERQRLLGYEYFGELELIDFDCRRRLSRIHQSTLRDAGGRAVFHSEFPDPASARYSAVVPGGVTEVKFAATCDHLRPE